MEFAGGGQAQREMLVNSQAGSAEGGRGAGSGRRCLTLDGVVRGPPEQVAWAQRPEPKVEVSQESPGGGGSRGPCRCRVLLGRLGSARGVRPNSSTFR